jgi:4-amino-4-deoxy-L-arabinose transferase-like glycosyltransferase
MQRAAGPSRRAGTRRRAPAALIVFAVALVLRLAWVTWTAPGAKAFDPARMDEVARHLAQGSGFTRDAGLVSQPVADVPPLVPWLLSLVYRVAGHRAFAALVLQCVLGAMIPLLLAGLGRSLFGDPIGLWCAWLATLHPLLIVACAELSAGTAFCATLSLAMLLSAEWLRTPRHGRALGTGLAWGMAALTHPAALPAPLVVAAWAWRPLGLAAGSANRLRQLGLLLLGVALVVAPWTLRNAIQTHSLALVTRGDGGPLTGAFEPAAWSAATGAPAIANKSGDLPGPLFAWLVVMAPLALWGLLWTMRSPRRWFQALPLVLIVMFIAIAAAFSGRPDMRMPVWMLATVYAAFGLEDARRRFRVRRSGLTVVRGRAGPPDSAEH